MIYQDHEKGVIGWILALSNIKRVAKKSKSKKKVETTVEQNRIGLQAHYLGNGTPAGKVNAAAIGGGLQFEPDFLNISESMKMGYIMEYTRSTGLADYQMFNNILYLQYHTTIADNPMLDFYGNFGVGGSYVSYTKNNERFEGLDRQKHDLLFGRKDHRTGHGCVTTRGIVNDYEEFYTHINLSER